MSLFKRQVPKAQKFKGQLVMQDFSYGLFKQDVPRALEEQLGSLALTSGRNVWSLRGALTTQYGYESNYQIDDDETIKLVPDTSSSSQSLVILTEEDTCYRYTNYEPLKKYKSSLPQVDDMVCVYNGASLYLYSTSGDSYIYGDRYNDDPTDGTGVTAVIDKTVTLGDVVQTSPDHFSVYITEADYRYLWIDKRMVIKHLDVNINEHNPGDKYYSITINSISKVEDDDIPYDYLVEFRFDSPLEFNDINNNIETANGETGFIIGIGDNLYLAEKTVRTLDSATEFVWLPENGSGSISTQPIVPKMMAVVLNRLWVVDQDNIIFYSAVGNMTSFDEANGAGYFYGFYNDTSEILSVEEYFSGALITKKNGMYHAKLTTKEYSYTDNIYGTAENYVNITKVNNIPQKYPGDHVIIGDEVIAYDAVSGNLVQAAYINYFGNLQQGNILLHGSEMASEELGLTSAVNRILGYNYQEEVLIIYYGYGLRNCLLIQRNLSMFPRELDKLLLDVKMFSLGLVCFTSDGKILNDFKRGKVIPNITPVAEFEPIALKGNKLLCGNILEFTELNNENFTLTTLNAGVATQEVTPSMLNRDEEVGEILPNMLYSNQSNPTINSDTTAGNSKWVYQKSACVRVAAPLSGRDGIKIRMEFPENSNFILCAIYIPDFSRGE